MNKLVPFALLFFGYVSGLSQDSSGPPRLVVGIVVDQMRQDYLYRFEAKFGNGGFRRLTSEGFQVMNGHYNYAPTVTGPGHASIYTGTTPAIHGIIGNDYYDKVTKKGVNCVEDSSRRAVGSERGNGDVSPFRMISSTITDELKLATQKRGKVISLSVKDRGAVLPGGHLPDGAYWFDETTGRFITSTYYCDSLPKWMAAFNAKGLADKFLSQKWTTLLPISQYTESGPDKSPYEIVLGGQGSAEFPYDLARLRSRNGGYSLLTFTPFANDLLTEAGLAAVEGESLGADAVPDFLAISYSTPDLVGHGMGPQSVELQDVYLRLDKNIEALLITLDRKVGAGNYVVFLSSDHGVSEVPQFLTDNRIPSGYFNRAKLQTMLSQHLEKYFPGKAIIESISNDQVFLNQEAFGDNPKSSGIDLLVVHELITNFLLQTRGVAQVFSETTLRQAAFDEMGIRGMIARGYNSRRSGDIAFVLEPGWITGAGPQGTTHGSPYAYDTHVPMLFFGKGIQAGRTVNYHAITDIAPTLSVLLRIPFPNGCTGQPVTEALK
jgi:predicted AlkP superfamily pyrophosphatase or phosphodiesterase